MAVPRTKKTAALTSRFSINEMLPFLRRREKSAVIKNDKKLEEIEL